MSGISKIGIGITTYNRPEHLRYCIEQIERFTKDYTLFVWDDAIDRKGVAYGKNMCIHNLKDCDYIFLFDDDCFPKAEGWADYFINSGYNHSCYMNDKYQRVYSGEKHLSYNLCAGAFIFITRKVVETVGYFNPKYGLYGYEHAAYCHRIYQSGLTPSRFITLKDTSEYIHSLDLDGIAGYEFLEHKRSITDTDRAESLKQNNPIYHEETTSHRIKYDFIP